MPHVPRHAIDSSAANENSLTLIARRPLEGLSLPLPSYFFHPREPQKLNVFLSTHPGHPPLNSYVDGILGLIV